MTMDEHKAILSRVRGDLEARTARLRAQTAEIKKHLPPSPLTDAHRETFDRWHPDLFVCGLCKQPVRGEECPRCGGRVLA